jgi:hypothetical protein
MIEEKFEWEVIARKEVYTNRYQQIQAYLN